MSDNKDSTNQPESEDHKVIQLIRQQGEYHRATDALRHSIMQQITTTRTSSSATVSKLPKNHTPPSLTVWIERQGKQLWQWLAAFAAGAALTSLVLFNWLPQQGDPTIAILQADHARAVVTGHLIEVASSDSHTVKPWLSNKLGYANSAPDLSEQGFPLLGGRIGYLGREQVAVLVYGYKEHKIDVYALPKREYKNIAERASQAGYQSYRWDLDDMVYIAISDANHAHLLKLGALYVAARD